MHISPDDIRTLFSRAMSDMYQGEVPHYATLLRLVGAINDEARATDPVLDRRLAETGELGRLALERHGAVRVGTPSELAMLRRLFAVMGMQPVGYYDLSAAGVPVHSTAFRPVTDEALGRNPFRVFTSLLRLELISEPALRAAAARILERRSIVTPTCLALIERAETDGALAAADARRFVAEALETFRWHGEATVDRATYEHLRSAHPLIADIVCFKGPHINHLTPRTLDIDAAQERMAGAGLDAKEVIEGPPRRRVPILLRQTSFKALQEPIRFVSRDGRREPGAHTARFGEIEQRGLALTGAGRALYDRLLAEARASGASGTQDGRAGGGAAGHEAVLEACFASFPDDEAVLRANELGFFRYRAAPGARASAAAGLETLLGDGRLIAEPITYEDFLPVSAAGIFRSNLGDRASAGDEEGESRQPAFEAALGVPVIDPLQLYEAAQAHSLRDALVSLQSGEPAGSAPAG